MVIQEELRCKTYYYNIVCSYKVGEAQVETGVYWQHQERCPFSPSNQMQCAQQSLKDSFSVNI